MLRESARSMVRTLARELRELLCRDRTAPHDDCISADAAIQFTSREKSGWTFRLRFKRRIESEVRP